MNCNIVDYQTKDILLSFIFPINKIKACDDRVREFNNITDDGTPFIINSSKGSYEYLIEYINDILDENYTVTSINLKDIECTDSIYELPEHMNLKTKQFFNKITSRENSFHVLTELIISAQDLGCLILEHDCLIIIADELKYTKIEDLDTITDSIECKSERVLRKNSKCKVLANRRLNFNINNRNLIIVKRFTV